MIGQWGTQQVIRQSKKATDNSVGCRRIDMIGVSNRIVMHLAHRTHAMTGTETLRAGDIKQELDARNASADHWPKSLSACCEDFLERTKTDPL